MITRIVLAIVVAVVVTIFFALLGPILETLKVEIATTIGRFFVAWGAVIGVLAGLWYFFAGGSFSLPKR